MRKSLDKYVEREMNRQKWIGILMYASLGLAFGLFSVFLFFVLGCAPVESDEDAVLEDLKYSVGQEPIPFAEERRPHYTALDGTRWYDNAGNILKENYMENPWTTREFIFESEKGKQTSINLYLIVCKYCDVVNFLPAQKIEQLCTNCRRMIKNNLEVG